MYHICHIGKVYNIFQSEFPEAFPVELDALIDKRYLFQYKVSRHNIDKGNKTYGIKRLTDDLKILNKFIEKHEVNFINTANIN